MRTNPNLSATVGNVEVHGKEGKGKFVFND